MFVFESVMVKLVVLLVLNLFSAVSWEALCTAEPWAVAHITHASRHLCINTRKSKSILCPIYIKIPVVLHKTFK